MGPVRPYHPDFLIPILSPTGQLVDIREHFRRQEESDYSSYIQCHCANVSQSHSYVNKWRLLILGSQWKSHWFADLSQVGCTILQERKQSLPFYLGTHSRCFPCPEAVSGPTEQEEGNCLGCHVRRGKAGVSAGQRRP